MKNGHIFLMCDDITKRALDLFDIMTAQKLATPLLCNFRHVPSLIILFCMSPLLSLVNTSSMNPVFGMQSEMFPPHPHTCFNEPIPSSFKIVQPHRLREKSQSTE